MPDITITQENQQRIREIQRELEQNAKQRDALLAELYHYTGLTPLAPTRKSFSNKLVVQALKRMAVV